MLDVDMDMQNLPQRNAMELLQRAMYIAGHKNRLLFLVHPKGPQTVAFYYTDVPDSSEGFGEVRFGSTTMQGEADSVFAALQ